MTWFFDSLKGGYWPPRNVHRDIFKQANAL